MAAGQDEYLPARDKGPVRRYARDFVDSRRTIGQYFFPIAVVVFLVNSFGAANPVLSLVGPLAFWALMMLIGIEATILNRRLKREVAKRFPGESTRGLTFYLAMRILQMRMMRFPRPQLAIGDPIPVKR